ncbi:MAG TPA: Ig-like domain-containing protein [Polyangia bacterium]|nr:Ig-like domain-containing protein [Polyangia bacterium]
MSIAVTPSLPSIAKGAQQQFVATGTFSDKTTMDVSSTVTWASATAATATISNAGLAVAVAPGTTAISATSGTISGNTTLTVTAAKLLSIAVTPALPKIAKGSTQAFVATGSYDDTTTKDISDTVTWASATAATATISSAGLATALAAGTTVISATSGAVSGSTTLTVTEAKLTSIAVTPAAPSLAKGSKQQFIATGSYDDATTQNLTAMVTWTSETPATATISDAAGSKGEATAVAVGTTIIKATSGAVSGMTTLTVTPAVLVSIAVTPATPSIAKGTKQQFVATGTYNDTTTQNLSDMVTWASATVATATISNAAGSKGEATAVDAGMTEISASIGAITGRTTLTVTAATLLSIAVTPAAPSIAKGTTKQFVATGTYSDTTTQNITAMATWASATAATATISNAAASRALATGVAPGTSVISASIGAISGNTTLAVTAATLVSIAVTPSTPSIAKGTKQQFVATGTYTDGTTQNLSATATWASATEATATISNAAGTKGLATSVAVGTTVISATIGTVAGNTTLTVTAATLVSIAVTPATPSIARGTRLRFAATGTYSDATTQDLTAAATWASATPATATISSAAGSDGLATGMAVGTTVISAAVGAIRGSTTLRVTNAMLVSIAVTPATPSIAKGTQRQFVATGFFNDATTQDVTITATWASATTATATISNAAGSNGLASGVGAGTSVISAAIGAVNGSTTLTVTAAVLTGLAVTPATPSIAKGTKQQFVATGTFSDGSKQDVTDAATWASATPATATISNAAGSEGLATALAVGTTVISATIGSIGGNVTLTVTAATLVSIAVTPPTPSVAPGTSEQFVATGTYSDATIQSLTTTVTWASATEATATISNAAGSRGRASAVAAGTSVISATVGAVTGSTTLTVTHGMLVSIAVTPASPRIANGTKVQFVATGTYNDASTQDLSAAVTWASATPARATISNAAGSSGLATAVSPGTSVISATLGTISGNTTLTVTSAALVSIAITPINVTIADGTTQQFVATGFFDDASTQDVSDTATWSSTMPAVATVSNAADSNGLATGVAVGMTSISATIGAVTGSATLRVTPATLVSIAVTPAAPTIAKGTRQQFVATGTYTDATTQNLTATVAWSSSVRAAATISNAAGTRGLASSVEQGATEISATSGTVVGKTTLTVTAATLVSIAVTPATPSIARGASQQFVARGTYSDATTQDLTSVATWVSGTPATATISNAAASRGVATSLAAGTTDITATRGDVVGHATLTVTN